MIRVASLRLFTTASSSGQWLSVSEITVVDESSEKKSTRLKSENYQKIEDSVPSHQQIDQHSVLLNSVQG